MLNLHSDFAERKTFSKGEFEWTQEKGKRYLNDTRRNLTDIIRRYEISGNGANQATRDNSDNELDDGDENRGRFNAKSTLASRVPAVDFGRYFLIRSTSLIRSLSPRLCQTSTLILLRERHFR